MLSWKEILETLVAKRRRGKQLSPTELDCATQLVAMVEAEKLSTISNCIVCAASDTSRQAVVGFDRCSAHLLEYLDISIKSPYAKAAEMATFVLMLISRKRMGTPPSCSDLGRAGLAISALPTSDTVTCSACVQERRTPVSFALLGLPMCAEHAHDAIIERVKMT